MLFSRIPFARPALAKALFELNLNCSQEPYKTLSETDMTMHIV